MVKMMVKMVVMTVDGDVGDGDGGDDSGSYLCNCYDKIP